MLPITLLRAPLVRTSFRAPLRGIRPFGLTKPLIRSLLYSTKSAPPPPPIDKNAKGKSILNKINRAFTWSALTVLVVGGAAILVIVILLVFSELFLPSGDTKTFNKALNIIEKDPNVQKIFGLEPGQRLKAHGDVSADKWVRQRPPRATKIMGQDGVERLFMRFAVELTHNGKTGIVVLEQYDTSWWSSEFAYIALDVLNKRYWVIEPKVLKRDLPKGSGFLGLNWGPKKD